MCSPSVWRGKVGNRFGRQECVGIGKAAVTVALDRQMWFVAKWGNGTRYWVVAGRTRKEAGVSWGVGYSHSRGWDWGWAPAGVVARGRGRGRRSGAVCFLRLACCRYVECTGMPMENAARCLTLVGGSPSTFLAP